MSRGPGKIEIAVQHVFDSEQDNAFTVEDLIDRVYTGVNRIEKKHRVALIRSAKKVCGRSPEWTWLISGGIGGTLVFFSPYNVMSYSIGRTKGEDCGNNYRVNDPRRARWPHWKSLTDEDVRKQFSPGGQKYDRVIEGGAWWNHTQMAIAERDRDCSPEALKLFEDRNRAMVAYGVKPLPLPAHFISTAQ